MKSANPLSDALHVMAHLVGQDGPRTSGQLASCLPTHPVVIRRLLAQLHKASLVRSTRGHGGGSQLARGLQQLGADFARHLAHHRSLEGPHES